MRIHDNNIRPEYKESVGKVLHYINQNLAGDVSLETLAGLANYSPFHFQKIFSEAMSESPKQYIIRLRLERLHILSRSFRIWRSMKLRLIVDFRRIRYLAGPLKITMVFRQKLTGSSLQRSFMKSTRRKTAGQPGRKARG
jgi:hypothetical protein